MVVDSKEVLGYIACICSHLNGVVPVGFSVDKDKAIEMCRNAYEIMREVRPTDSIGLKPVKEITEDTPCFNHLEYIPTRRDIFNKIYDDIEFYINSYYDLDSEERVEFKEDYIEYMENQLNIISDCYTRNCISLTHYTQLLDTTNSFLNETIIK